MNLHIFNPEHDIALAYDKAHITMPHAAQELRMNLGFLPALWASDGDCVLVDDIKFALKAVAPLREYAADVLFVEKSDIARLPIDRVEPWGWDKRICAELLENGISESLVPSADNLSAVRRLSNRCHTSDVLRKLRRGMEDATCGESFLCADLPAVEAQLHKYGSIVVKSPWSSSGRGVRYADGEIDSAKRAWIEKSISRQGHVMVEPHYNKVCDFAAEFVAGEDGRVRYRGLSVFHTVNGQYTGNVIASEADKEKRLERYVPKPVLDAFVRRLEDALSEMIGSAYCGQLGVDMMVVADGTSGRLLVDPCVEINVRRTMGHVALSLAENDFQFASMMSIVHKVNYELRLSRIEGNFVIM